ncbi:preprotein translocase, SecG subunit [Peptoanaerobacter stomatis]|uniref:Protein-export membrane protein SecG n=1 Tax=Peptoanaerobacter stomatis TaxID=796937 RepID=J5UNJ7_9FIRM|nr:preprotein translocase subunit SecG [Peptoanaerobacter stomatis]EJU23914.1 preprotein translocase, SecG subunit [Peptoanaerobacter stomatis]NWO25646.1 preprotein translocase subunit SecG [Peptostreptococcaceae bacterium oral taxon 081]
MKTALMVIELIISLVLIFSIMLQSGRDAGFSGAVSGMSDNLSGNKAKGLDDFYKKVTSVMAVLFIIISLALTALH